MKTSVRARNSANPSKQMKKDNGVAISTNDHSLVEKHSGERMTTPLRDAIELGLSVLAIYVCYLAYGILHEKMTRQPYGAPGHEEKFQHPFFLTTVQCIGSMLWAVFLIFLEANRRMSANPLHSHTSFGSRLYYLIFDNVPKHKYAIIATSYTIAMISSTSALSYISYPVQALAKSSKLIPVMVGRILGGAKYSFREYLHVLAITGGIAVFFLAEQSGKVAKAGPENSLVGIFLLLLSLTMDAITGPTQDSVSETYRPAVMSMTFWINFFPAVAMGSYITLTGEFVSAYNFCVRHPEIITELIMYCILSAVGQSIIVWALFRFNSMTVTVITTTRKFCSILVSVIWFGNTLGLVQWLGVLCVFAGIGSDSHFKYVKKQAQQKLKLEKLEKQVKQASITDNSEETWEGSQSKKDSSSKKNSNTKAKLSNKAKNAKKRK